MYQQIIFICIQNKKVKLKLATTNENIRNVTLPECRFWKLQGVGKWKVNPDYFSFAYKDVGSVLR